MKKILIIALLGLSQVGFSQRHLPGLWKGLMTTGGLNSTTGYTFELYLDIEGAKISGRSYVHISEEETVEMEIKGIMNVDRSLNLYDIEFIVPADQTLIPEFSRKYQLSYKRSAWEEDSSLNGFWQQIVESPFGKQRKRGRIFLKKVTTSKA